jgi:hypothetical protein
MTTRTEAANAAGVAAAFAAALAKPGNQENDFFIPIEASNCSEYFHCTAMNRLVNRPDFDIQTCR